MQRHADAVRDFERMYLGDVLEKAHYNISRAARLAQLNRTYLYKLLTKHGLPKGINPPGRPKCATTSQQS